MPLQLWFCCFLSWVLSMLGVLVLALAIGVWLMPALDSFYAAFGVDPSVIPAAAPANSEAK